MGIKIGNLDISYFKVGSDDCSIYLGDILLYPTTQPFNGKWLATYSGGSTSSAECDSTSAITQNEITLTDLVSVKIGDCVTSIGNSVFSSCSGLTSIDIPDSVTSIGNAAFSFCRSLTSINIPSGVTSINNNTFNGCSSLTSIDIPDSVTSIGSYAFRNCSGLTSIEIPSGVTSIDSQAFNRCSGLTSVTIGNGVTSIGDRAFYYCTGLSSVTVLATTPPTLGSGVFDNTNDCPIYVPSSSVNTYKSASGWSEYANRIQAIPTFDGKWLATYDGGSTSSAECDSTSAITSSEIAQNDLVSVKIGDCVTSIGDESFRYCTSLTGVTIGNAVASIGDYAFYGCSNLTTINTFNSVTSIGVCAFESCTSLTSCTIGSGVTNISRGVFDTCTSLTSVTVLATTPPTLGGGVFFNTNNCPIYVPSQSVNAYKSATNWSTYASRITAIPNS